MRHGQEGGKGIELEGLARYLGGTYLGLVSGWPDSTNGSRFGEVTTHDSQPSSLTAKVSLNVGNLLL